MDIIFNLNFWFNTRPAPFSYSSKIAMGLFIILMVAFFAFLKIMKDKGYNNKFWLNLNDFLLTNIVIAICLLFFSLELVPFLSAKFWILLWLAEMIIWLVMIVKKLKKSKIKKLEEEKTKHLKKYLPKK